jgi:pantoate--beta-alanine ligase
MHRMVKCLLALGSNVGDRVGNLTQALDELAARGNAGMTPPRNCDTPAIRILETSSFFETRPVGGPVGQPRFLNAAATIETQLSPTDLLRELQAVEHRLGRVRGEHWGPRTIDLDLLFFGDAVIDEPQLVVPHPQVQERRFVLAPAEEIAGSWRHPVLGQTVAELLDRLPPAESGEMSLRVFTSPRAMQGHVRQLQRAGRRVGLVPTMGALHEGHLSLVGIARERADVVVATIFVNPTQFGPKEDFAKYPRTLESDLAALSRAGCDLVFVPQAQNIYPPGFSTSVEPPAVAAPFEGVCRPGHFRGVATVVLKLFHIVPADVACFGRKDFQQALVIRRMAADLNLPIEIAVCPIVREPDGLAMSSRNRYLSPAERQQALALSRSLDEAQRLVASGERSASALLASMRNILNAAGIERIDYVALADPETLAEKPLIDGPTVALIACFVGATRLIDNALLNAGGEAKSK